ncbi:MAG: hypothetical protein ACLFUO_02450 [Candidatus Woesearchaeota archaeon]
MNFTSCLLFVACFVLILVASGNVVQASTETLDVRVLEYITEVIAYDQTLGEDNVISDTRGELGENDTGISRTGHQLKKFNITGIINISNTETVGNSTVVSINVTINGTENITRISLRDQPAENYLVYNISGTDSPVRNSTISIFIAELRGGDSAVFEFDVEGHGVGEPLNFTEEYSSWRMMSGNATDITLNVTNSFPTPIRLSDIVIRKTPGCYESYNGVACFRFSDLTGDDSGNATISGNPTILEWNASGGYMDQYDSRQILFKAWAPENVTLIDLNGNQVRYNDSEDWASWMNMGNLSASFNFNGSITGLELINVTGIVPYSRVSVSKDRINESHWNATFNITNDAPAPVDYRLNHISIWATQQTNHIEDYNPGNQNNWVENTNVSATGYSGFLGPYANATWWPRVDLLADENNDNYSIVFNYSLVPVVWAHANFELLDDGTQIFKLNRTETIDDGYLFIEEIYVLLGGYLVKVTKTVDPVDLAPLINNSYQINITIENIGQERTPEWVSMFDLIPKDFSPLLRTTDSFAPSRSMTVPNRINVTTWTGSWVELTSGPATSSTVLGYADTGEITSGPYEGYWGYHIDFNGINATSNGNGQYDVSYSDREIGVRYRIAGNKTISRVENAYIVGVDPIRLEGGNPSRSVTSRLAASSTTMEYVVLIGSLLVSITILGLGFGLVKRK